MFTNIFCTLNKYILQFGQIHFQSWAVLEEWKGANCLINFFSRQFNPVADLCVWKLLLKYREEIELNIEFLWVALIVYKSISVWNFPFTKIGHNAAISALVFKYIQIGLEKEQQNYCLICVQTFTINWYMAKQLFSQKIEETKEICQFRLVVQQIKTATNNSN